MDVAFGHALMECVLMAAVYPLSEHLTIANLVFGILAGLVGGTTAFVFQRRTLNLRQKVAKATLIQRLSEQAYDFKKVTEQLHQRRITANAATRVQTGSVGIGAQSGELDLTEAREFLRFLEMLMLIIEGSVLNEDDIFPLYAYRILLALNDPLVRETFLAKSPEAEAPMRSFCALFALHHHLLRYFSHRCGKHFQEVIADLGFTRETDISTMPYYKAGVVNHHELMHKPFSKKRGWKVSYKESAIGWPAI